MNMMTSNIKDKKVLFVLNNLEVGGAERVVLNTLREFNKKQWSADLFLTTRKGAFTTEIDDYYDTYSLQVSDNIFAPVRKLFYFLKIAKKYDVVVGACETFPILLAIIASKLCACNSIGWVHIDIEQHANQRPLFKKLVYTKIIRKIFHFVDCFVTPSKGVASSLRNWIGEKSTIPIVSIPNIMDFGVFENINSDLSTDLVNWIGNDLLVIGAGRLAEQKNFSCLIKAHAILLENCVKHKLVILGEGPEREKLRDLVIDLGVDNSVRLEGFVANPLDYFKLADIFVLSSVREGLPTVILEAMSIGLPIVSANCPHGPLELLDGGEFGVLVKMNDQDDMAEAIKTLVKDANMRNHFSLKSLERITHYTPEKSIVLWGEIVCGSVKNENILKITT